MLIERLIIRKTYPTEEIIRDIPFKRKGLSLIVDSTTNVSEDSGNNVGKTTVIKIIDLCLGAKSVGTLYYDEDTRSENIDIKKFLSDNKVEAELILVSDEKDISKKKVNIIRQLYSRGKRIIDGIDYTKEEFWEELKYILFGSREPYPTFRQLIPKFIRLNDKTSDNMIKYLPGNQTNETYDTIYLFFFKILKNELLSKKDILANQLNECEKKLRLYIQDDNVRSLDSLKQRKELIDNELSGLIVKRKNLSYMEEYKEELQKKRELTTKINDIENKIQLIEMEVHLINKNIGKLMNEKSNVNVSQINYIYQEAKAYIGDLHKTFEDVVNFHNTMIQNRINFISSQLESKYKELEHIIKSRDELLEEKKKVTVELLDEGLLDELNTLNSKIDNLNIKKGELQQSIKMLEGVNAEKQSIIDAIKEIEKQLDNKNITEKIRIFNSYFSTYCEKLYGEKYLFVYNSYWREEKSFPVSLDAFNGGKLGTGMKKGLIIAFDLAYISYTKKIHITSPKFVIHDKLENTHINQLKTIFELCQKIDGQFITPILRERVDKVDADLIERSKVLELSTNDKLFKI